MLDPVPDGGTPLHFAACKYGFFWINNYKFVIYNLKLFLFVLAAGKLKTVRWLVNNDMTGLLVSAKDENGDTPAHDAAGSG